MHSIYIYHLDIYWYICRISCGTTGCTDGEGPEGTQPSSDPDGVDAYPCPEDDEFFGAPDAESQEEAINRFMEGLEQQERRGLNHILNAHVVDGALTTFGCVEWESDLFRGTMRARCYPFDMKNRRFHSFNPKVCQ
jgi:hypothetical protein